MGYVFFHITPALSQGRGRIVRRFRGIPATEFGSVVCAKHAPRGAVPSPRGEGQGEGKQRLDSHRVSHIQGTPQGRPTKPELCRSCHLCDMCFDTELTTNQPANLPASPRFLPLLLLLFVGSGCAALMYEIVWFQLLQLVVGSSAISLGVLLGTFMGGMCLGSLALPRFISPRLHPLRVYAALEAGIGALGLALLYFMPLVTRLYVANAAQGLTGLLLRGLICAACLLPPTLLMGATLPAIS